MEELLRLNDSRKKEKAKQYTDLKRKAVRHSFKVGENVLLWQKRIHKSMAPCADRELVVVDVKKPMITVEAVYGKRLTRDASKFKRKMFSGSVSERVDARLGANQART